MPYFRTSDGVRIKYRVEGEGKPVIFIHGWAASSNFWYKQVEFFSRLYKIVTYDLRGHGDSDKPSPGDYSLDRLVEDHVELCSHLNISHLIVIGHSLGSLIALKSYFKLEPSIEKLVLISPPLHTVKAGRLQTALLKLILRSEMISRLLITPFLFGPKTEKGIIEFVRSESTKASKYALVECLRNTSYPNLLQDLAKVNVPVLIFYGGYERLVSKMEIEKLSEVRNVKTIVLREAGHNLMLEKPDEFNRLLKDFLAGKLES